MTKLNRSLLRSAFVLLAMPSFVGCGGSETGRHLLRDNATYKSMGHSERKCFEVFAAAELDRCKANCPKPGAACQKACTDSFDTYVRTPVECAKPVMVIDGDGR